MTIQHLTQAMLDCDHGLVPFNQGNNRSFLYGKKWYPLRGVVNYARSIAGEGELTTDRALIELIDLGIYARIADANYVNNLPVQLNDQERLAEAHTISQVLELLVQ